MQFTFRSGNRSGGDAELSSDGNEVRMVWQNSERVFADPDNFLLQEEDLEDGSTHEVILDPQRSRTSPNAEPPVSASIRCPDPQTPFQSLRHRDDFSVSHSSGASELPHGNTRRSRTSSLMQQSNAPPDESAPNFSGSLDERAMSQRESRDGSGILEDPQSSVRHDGEVEETLSHPDPVAVCGSLYEEFRDEVHANVDPEVPFERNFSNSEPAAAATPTRDAYQSPMLLLPTHVTVESWEALQRTVGDYEVETARLLQEKENLTAELKSLRDHCTGMSEDYADAVANMNEERSRIRLLEEQLEFSNGETREAQEAAKKERLAAQKLRLELQDEKLSKDQAIEMASKVQKESLNQMEKVQREAECLAQKEKEKLRDDLEEELQQMLHAKDVQINQMKKERRGTDALRKKAEGALASVTAECEELKLLLSDMESEAHDTAGRHEQELQEFRAKHDVEIRRWEALLENHKSEQSDISSLEASFHVQLSAAEEAKQFSESRCKELEENLAKLEQMYSELGEELTRVTNAHERDAARMTGSAGDETVNQLQQELSNLNTKLKHALASENQASEASRYLTKEVAMCKSEIALYKNEGESLREKVNGLREKLRAEERRGHDAIHSRTVHQVAPIPAVKSKEVPSALEIASLSATIAAKEQRIEALVVEKAALEKKLMGSNSATAFDIEHGLTWGAKKGKKGGDLLRSLFTLLASNRIGRWLVTCYFCGLHFWLLIVLRISSNRAM